MEYFRKEGEETFPLEEDFWDWWMNNASYSQKEEDQVDFCFLYDDEYPILHYEFPETEVSVWNKETVGRCLKEIIPAYAVQVCDKNGAEAEMNPGYYRKGPKKLKTNLSLNSKPGKREVPGVDGDEKMSRFAEGLTERLESWGKQG